MSVFKVKVVGLSFNKISSPVEVSDYVILRADPTNEFDSDAITVLTANQELLGFVANTDKTLSDNNRANGNLSATGLKEVLPFDNREFYGQVVKSFSSCIYLEIDSEHWSYINKPVDEVPELKFTKAIDLLEPEVSANEVDVIEPISEDVTLAVEIAELKKMVSELLKEVKDLKNSIGEGVNPPSKSSSERMLLSVVGLSHFQGQDNLGDILTIAEEPIFEGAKGTALYLKSGDYRVGVFPSERKREYCEEHGIPYYENKLLKNKDFGSDIRIEELVYDEYAIISV